MSILVAPRMLWMIWDSLHATNNALDIYMVVQRDLCNLVFAVWPGAMDPAAKIAGRPQLRPLPEPRRDG